MQFIIFLLTNFLNILAPLQIQVTFHVSSNCMSLCQGGQESLVNKSHELLHAQHPSEACRPLVNQKRSLYRFRSKLHFFQHLIHKESYSQTGSCYNNDIFITHRHYFFEQLRVQRHVFLHKESSELTPLSLQYHHLRMTFSFITHQTSHHR